MLENYRILELPYGASKTQVKEAFHRLAKIHHPDKGGDLKKMQAISAAYAALRNTAPDSPATPRTSNNGTGGSGSSSTIRKARTTTRFNGREFVFETEYVDVDPEIFRNMRTNVQWHQTPFRRNAAADELFRAWQAAQKEMERNYEERMENLKRHFGMDFGV